MGVDVHHWMGDTELARFGIRPGTQEITSNEILELLETHDVMLWAATNPSRTPTLFLDEKGKHFRTR